MKAIKIIDNGEIFISTILVMCCLGYIDWSWFWIGFICMEANAFIWMKRMEQDN